MIDHSWRLSEPHVVYRAYDADWNLLYVGCTYDLPNRLAHHRRNQSPWWEHYARITTEKHTCHARAAAAEARAIRLEQPLFNLNGHAFPKRVDERRAAYLASRQPAAA
jgi:predicted GIY-YIG superfamily endonuclease